MECRKSALLRPMIAKFLWGNMPLDPPPPAVKHLWCIVGACIVMSGKVHFLTNTTPPPHPKHWPPACLLPCYRFAYGVGQAALAERLLTQLLSSRSEKYECTHKGRWDKMPTIRISGCHSAILITKLDVPASIGVHEDSHPKAKNTAPCPEDSPCNAVGVWRWSFLQRKTTGTHWSHLTDQSCTTRKERFCPQAHQKSHVCIHGQNRLAGLTMITVHSSHAQQVDTQTILQNYKQTPGGCSASRLRLTNWNSPSSQMNWVGVVSENTTMC